MTTLLRQFVAGPRARHPEAKLDLCYVTKEIMVTSGPARAYPSLAYRNPLPRLLEFIQSRHGTDWCIFEFRAEGTGYTDAEVEHRIKHYPWPDHHPPPFGVIVNVVKDLEAFLVENAGGEPVPGENKKSRGVADTHGKNGAQQSSEAEDEATRPNDRDISDKVSKLQKTAERKLKIAILHCKAGKGRSGTVACSYLIGVKGWSAASAMQRFTERRMRPGWGNGISILSQRRWISYVERWAKSSRQYTTSRALVKEVRLYGLREGTSVCVRGFADGGKKIVIFHTWEEVEGDRSVLSDAAFGEDPDGTNGQSTPRKRQAGNTRLNSMLNPTAPDLNLADKALQTGSHATPSCGTSPADASGTSTPRSTGAGARKTHGPIFIASVFRSKLHSAISSSSQSTRSSTPGDTTPPQLDAPSAATHLPPTVTTLRPSKPILLPTADVNVSITRRARPAFGLPSVVTSTAHSWFNVYFEGEAPENDGKAQTEGVHTVAWDEMDGLKGSAKRGLQCVQRIEVDWEIAPPEADGLEGLSEGLFSIAGGKDDGLEGLESGMKKAKIGEGVKTGQVEGEEDMKGGESEDEEGLRSYGAE